MKKKLDIKMIAYGELHFVTLNWSTKYYQNCDERVNQ